MDNSLKVELVYIASDRGFLGCTVIFKGENYSVTILGPHTQERLIEIAVTGWLDSP